jgi:hypothetical protein
MNGKMKNANGGERDQWEKDRVEWERNSDNFNIKSNIYSNESTNNSGEIFWCAVFHRTFNESWKFWVVAILCAVIVWKRWIPIATCSSLFVPTLIVIKPIRLCFDFYPNVVEA